MLSDDAVSDGDRALRSACLCLFKNCTATSYRSCEKILARPAVGCSVFMIERGSKGGFVHLNYVNHKSTDVCESKKRKRKLTHEDEQDLIHITCTTAIGSLSLPYTGTHSMLRVVDLNLVSKSSTFWAHLHGEHIKSERTPVLESSRANPQEFATALEHMSEVINDLLIRAVDEPIVRKHVLGEQRFTSEADMQRDSRVRAR